MPSALSLLPAFGDGHLVCLCPSCTAKTDSVVPLGVGPTTCWCTALEWGSTPPQGLSLRTGLFCPSPSPLISPIRPTRGHIATSPTLRLIRDAFAVRERLGDPRVVPSFHCIFLPGMPPSMSPGRSESTFTRYFDSNMGLRQDLNGSALPIFLPSVSSRARFQGLLVHHCCGLSGCSPP